MSERKAAIITGSATGVGAATALGLAHRGYDVLINYSKSEAQAQASGAACRAAGADTLLLRGDVAEDADCRALAEAALGRWGRIDALVNNAGITSFAGTANWDAVWLVDGARTVTGELVLLDSGMHLGRAAAVAPPRQP